MLSKMYRTPPPRSNPPSPVNLTSAPSLVSQFLRPPSSSSSSSSVSKTVGATVVASEIMARLAISTVAAPICVFIWPASKGWGKQDGKCRNCIWYKCTASTPGTSRACKGSGNRIVVIVIVSGVNILPVILSVHRQCQYITVDL